MAGSRKTTGDQPNETPFRVARQAVRQVRLAHKRLIKVLRRPNLPDHVVPAQPESEPSHPSRREQPVPSETMPAALRPGPARPVRDSPRKDTDRSQPAPAIDFACAPFPMETDRRRRPNPDVRTAPDAPGRRPRTAVAACPKKPAPRRARVCGPARETPVCPPRL